MVDSFCLKKGFKKKKKKLPKERMVELAACLQLLRITIDKYMLILYPASA